MIPVLAWMLAAGLVMVAAEIGHDPPPRIKSKPVREKIVVRKQAPLIKGTISVRRIDDE